MEETFMGIRSLILAGGGSLGAFQGGVLYELTKNGYHYDKIYGTSTGAMNALLLAQAYIDKSPEIIKTTWTETIKGTSNIYSRNFLDWFISRPPYNYKPLRKLLKKIISFEDIMKLEEKICVTATDLVSGDTKFFSNKTEGITTEKFFECVIGSGSFPPMFDAVIVEDMKLVDGGVKENTPVAQIVEDWDSENVTVVLCRPEQMSPSNAPFTGLIEIASRAIDLMMNKITNSDLKFVLLINELLKSIDCGKVGGLLKYKKVIDLDILMPEKELPGSTLIFDKFVMQTEFIFGNICARNYMRNEKDQADKMAKSLLI